MIEYYKNLSLDDIEGEVWRDIEDYEGLYQISTFGRVKSKVKRKHKILIQGSCLKYLYVILAFKKIHKTKTVHRMVAQAFVLNIEKKPHVNHRDGNKLNNCTNNLEWVTPSENMAHAVKNNLFKTNTTKIAVRGREPHRHQRAIPVVKLSEDYSFIEEFKCIQYAIDIGYTNHISLVCKGKRNYCGGFRWMYKSDYQQRLQCQF